MAHYKIQDPYRRDYWDGHYLCLWEVTPEEVVNVWSWDDLRSEPNWFEEIIMLAVERQRENRERGRVAENRSSATEGASGSEASGNVRLDDSEASDVSEDDSTEANGN